MSNGTEAKKEHMSHIYENVGLTFAQIKDIFNKASSGQLEGTEKVDGQQILISYSVQDQEAKAIRNKQHREAGGINTNQMVEYFTTARTAEGKNPAPEGVISAYTQAMANFETVAKSLPSDVQNAFFGQNADTFYNAEVMSPSSRNTINYDVDTLTVHRVGHGKYDETGKLVKITKEDSETAAMMLEKALTQVEQSLQASRLPIQVNAVKQLQALSDDTALNATFTTLDREMRSAGVSDSNTITDYLIARLVPEIRSIIQLPEDVEALLLKRLLKIEGVHFNHIVKNLDPQTKETVREIVKSEKTLKKNAINPLEMIIHDFSVEMLRGLESAYILDNSTEVQKLRSEVEQAKDLIEKSGIDEAVQIFNTQWGKIKAIENISTAMEGFVFDYDGHTYKFTGNFAPMNQILGLFKFGRGKIPPLKGLSEHKNYLLEGKVKEMSNLDKILKELVVEVLLNEEVTPEPGRPGDSFKVTPHPPEETVDVGGQQYRKLFTMDTTPEPVKSYPIGDRKPGGGYEQFLRDQWKEKHGSDLPDGAIARDFRTGEVVGAWDINDPNVAAELKKIEDQGRYAVMHDGQPSDSSHPPGTDTGWWASAIRGAQHDPGGVLAKTALYSLVPWAGGKVLTGAGRVVAPHAPPVGGALQTGGRVLSGTPGTQPVAKAGGKTLRGLGVVADAPARVLANSPGVLARGASRAGLPKTTNFLNTLSKGLNWLRHFEQRKLLPFGLAYGAGKTAHDEGAGTLFTSPGSFLLGTITNTPWKIVTPLDEFAWQQSYLKIPGMLGYGKEGGGTDELADFTVDPREGRRWAANNEIEQANSLKESEIKFIEILAKEQGVDSEDVRGQIGRLDDENLKRYQKEFQQWRAQNPDPGGITPDLTRFKPLMDVYKITNINQLAHTYEQVTKALENPKNKDNEELKQSQWTLHYIARYLGGFMQHRDDEGMVKNFNNAINALGLKNDLPEMQPRRRLRELSSASGGSVEGYSYKKDDEELDSLIREEEAEIIEEVLDNLLTDLEIL